LTLIIVIGSDLDEKDLARYFIGCWIYQDRIGIGIHQQINQRVTLSVIAKLCRKR